MTVRLDATEKVVIRCTEHVRDFRLVDPAVTQPFAVCVCMSVYNCGLTELFY